MFSLAGAAAARAWTAEYSRAEYSDVGQRRAMPVDNADPSREAAVSTQVALTDANLPSRLGTPLITLNEEFSLDLDRHPLPYLCPS
jgi:hypothetical protein